MEELFNAVHQARKGDFFGQEKNRLVIFTMIKAANKRGEQPGHILLHGPEDSGKKFLADIIAQEIGNKTRYIDGGSNAILYPSALASILTNLDMGSALIIQDLDKMKLQMVEEVLSTAMEENGIDIVIGKGPSARRVRLDLPHFTVIATVSDIRRIPKRLQNSFELICKMVDYSSADISLFIQRLSEQTGMRRYHMLQNSSKSR